MQPQESVIQIIRYMAKEKDKKMPVKLFEIDEVSNCFDLKDKIVIVIGRGSGKTAHIYDKNIPLFFINDSMLPNEKSPQLYPYATCFGTSVIVETHFTKNFPLVNHNCTNIIYIRKIKMIQLELILGCTPSLFLSYLIKYSECKRIILQGFSFDGISQINDPFPYEWSRQKKTIGECFDLDIKKGIDIGFATSCPMMKEYRHYTEE